MKKVLHDENGFPLNVDRSKFYQEPERFFPLPPHIYNTDPNMYTITTWGRIYNNYTGTCVPRELTRNKNMYIIVMLKDIHNNPIFKPMHQIVANVFCPIVPIGEFICPNHKDGVKWHNEVHNLEWVTFKENATHANSNDLIERPYGEDNGQSALTDDQYRQICQLTQDGYKAYEINNIMNLGFDITNIAQKIRNGTSETIIAKDYDFSNIPRNDYRKFDINQVRYICECLQNKPNMSYTEILNSMNYYESELGKVKFKKLRNTIYTIKKRLSYKEIAKDYNF